MPGDDEICDAELIEQLGDWARAALAGLIPHDAPIRLVKQRPWSTVLMVEAGDTRFFVKANCPGQRAEPVLLQQLAQWVPGAVVAPLAVNSACAWMVLPDGGETLAAMQLHRDGAAWAPAIKALARAQRAANGRGRNLVARGVHDFHPSSIPDRIRWTGIQLGLSGAEHRRIHMLAYQLEPIARALASSPLADGVSHGDFHSNNVFAPPTSVPFDWGDAVVGHPFCTLTNLRWSLEDDEFYGALREIYLREWADLLDDTTLSREAELAEIAGCVASIWTWIRVGPAAIERHPNAIPTWIDRLEGLLAR